MLSHVDESFTQSFSTTKMVMTMQMHQAFQLLQVTGQELEDALLEECVRIHCRTGRCRRSLTDAELEQLIQYRDQQAEQLEDNNGAETGEIDWDALIESGVFYINTKVSSEDMPFGICLLRKKLFWQFDFI